MAAIIRWLLVVFWMSAIFALSSISSLQVPFAHSYDFVLRKLAHISEYAVLTILLWWALQLYTGSRVRAWLLAALAAALYGLSDEWHQSWIVGRYGAFELQRIHRQRPLLFVALRQLPTCQRGGRRWGRRLPHKARR
jgi:VanZ family protein